MALTGFSTTTTITDDRGNALKGVTIAVTGPNGYTGTVVTNSQNGSVRLGLASFSKTASFALDISSRSREADV